MMKPNVIDAMSRDSPKKKHDQDPNPDQTPISVHLSEASLTYILIPLQFASQSENRVLERQK